MISLNKMDIYNASPIFIQNIMTSLEGRRRAKIRFGKYYKTALDNFRNFDYTKRENIIKIQNERFLEILSYAVTHSPFYKEFYKDIDISQIKSVEDISKLPVLEKDILRKNLDKIYTISEKESYISKTGGTTGKSLIFRHTLKDYQYRLAYLDFFKENHGFIHRQMKRASFNSSKIVPPNQKKKVFWRDNKAMNQRLYSTHRCCWENIKYYVENLNEYKPDSIDGYPSSIYEIARYINENNISLTFQPIAIFTTSETLYPLYRKEIEKAFSCKIYDQYSSSEGSTFVLECDCGNLHIGEDTGIIELTSQNEMLITSFYTHGTPLIRYNIGDKALLNDEYSSCSCGCSMKTLSSLEGRSNEYILSQKFGKFTSVHLMQSVELLCTKVKSAKFVQNELYTLDVYLEVEDGYDVSQDVKLKNDLLYKLGSDMKIIFHHVSSLPKEPNGKLRSVINKL